MRTKWIGLLGLCAALAWTMPQAAQAHGDDDKGSGDSGQHQKHIIFTGQVTAVNANNSTVTFTNKNNESKTYTIPAGTKIMVNGKDATLADVQVGMYGGVKSTEDGTPIMMRAESPNKGVKDSKHIFTGQVTAVDANAGSITFTNKNNESHTVTVTANTKIKVNGKEATLADVQVGMYGGVKMGADGKTPEELRAESPHGDKDKHQG
jgi:hypothetical protein